MKKKAIELRQILKDRNAQLQCDTQIRESQRYIDYFTEELRRLQTRGNRASFISMQSFHLQNDSPTDTTTSSTNSNTAVGSGSTISGSSAITQQPFTESPDHTLPSQQSYFPANALEEEDSRRRYTNLGKEQICIILKKKDKCVFLMHTM